MDKIQIVKEKKGFRILVCTNTGEILFRSEKTYSSRPNAVSAGSGFARRHDKRSFEFEVTTARTAGSKWQNPTKVAYDIKPKDF